MPFAIIMIVQKKKNKTLTISLLFIQNYLFVVQLQFFVVC